ncbi:DNA primase small subunit [Nematocida major]|uniref:DNA primase small subunit n=1 Tax=Nematocida major TaxID=1912982 RepID=UPI0020077B61|nr:DNA primase small subunit [Nematocida major]KAH9385507.1 DNA primase small subunit [Nematocida major]
MQGNEKENILGAYYRSAFPTALIAKWLRYTRTREFSFTLANDIYIRYITISSARELANKLVADRPQKIDIGGVYVHRPASVTAENQCVIKELVFDIDLTDYKRACCTDKNMCNTCFPIIKCAAEILDIVLREDFGFKNILFVYSGGRGVHCWVSDSTAMTLTGRDRSNIAEYFAEMPKRSNEEVEKILRKYQASMGIDEKASLGSLYDLLFPKLDANVTKQMKHLLKSPFCIHPRTGRVCVPLDLARMESLQLEDIPTLSSVLESPGVLAEHIEYFEKFIQLPAV